MLFGFISFDSHFKAAEAMWLIPSMDRGTIDKLIATSGDVYL